MKLYVTEMCRTAHIWLLAALCVPLLVLEGVKLYNDNLEPALQGRRAFIIDYEFYHTAAARFREDPLSLYMPKSKASLTGYLYPPPAVLLFLPWSSRPAAVPYVIASLSTYLLVVGAILFWLATLEAVGGLRLSASLKIALLGIALASAPVYVNSVYGQVNALLLFLMTAGVRLAVAGRGHWKALGGTLLGAAAWIKVFPILLLAAAVTHRRLRPVGLWMAASLAAIPALIIALDTSHPWPSLFEIYLRDYLPRMSSRTITHILNQSLPALVSRLLGADPESWRAVETPLLARSLTSLFGAVVLGALFLYRKHVNVATAAAVLLAVMCLTSPLGWGYTYVLALPLVMMAFVQAAGYIQQLIVAVLFLAFCVPSYTPAPEALPDFLKNVFYSRYALSTICYMAFICLHRTLTSDNQQPAMVTMKPENGVDRRLQAAASTP